MVSWLVRLAAAASLVVISQGLDSSSSSSSHANGTLSTARSSSYPAASVLPKNSSSALKPLFQPYSNETPVFQNEALIRQLSSSNSKRSLPLRSLARRDQPTGTCAPGSPCTNGACCSNTGVCSYAPTSCAADVCISNCDAKAPCGEYADPSNATCPLNVCCSQYGFCGSTDDFCGTGCQSSYGSCGDAPTPSCSGSSTNARRIGYYESWANTRQCDAYSPENLDLTGMTHINFAFSFFDPSTFQISPMDANAASLLSRFTALKTKQPSLQTWLSIGGWSFNDATNTPNTQTAFSDMVGSAANREAFISGLQNFMQTYGFDGIDIDWEYPAADDRGGVAADFSNYPLFVSELRATLGDNVGISATLPSSYWYLQHFDVVSLAASVDWFNFMSYDIHGVWDSTDKFTGPYIRPHTNLTEIQDGLSLLWRAGVDPSKVVLGLGWYGRSFTLSDASCSTPNGVCEFSGGGIAGECTQSSGTLSNAEIKRIIASGVGSESYDSTAAVKWLAWDSDQWVSYDDGITMQQKMDAANRLCLGGVMIWSLDQDNRAGDSLSDLMGIGAANGVTETESTAYKEQLANATLQQSIASSCYWTLCGGQCSSGYFDVTEARGQVAGIQQDSVCTSGDYQTLCCAPGTTMGTCQWEGFRGIGLPCTPVCNDTDATIVARNSNSYEQNDGGQTLDLTCTGGYQAYCCSGFIPSAKTNTGNMFLYGQGVLSKRDGSMVAAVLEKRKTKGSTVLTAGICTAALAALIAEAPFTFGISLLGIPVEIALCAAAGIVIAAGGFASVPTNGGSSNPQPAQVASPSTGVPTTVGSGKKARSSYGQWPLLDFGTVAQTNCDCVVTYTCRYDLGWDEVCDNQRWAIDKMLNGQTVYHVANGRVDGRNQASWAVQRDGRFRTLVQGSRSPKSAQCQVDEFPMGNLEESGNHNPQACRLVNGAANGAQGNDYKMWKMAQWTPCSSFRKTVCKSKGGPPVTWKFGNMGGNRGNGNGQHFVTAYGFDSQTLGSLCFASYSYTDAQNKKTDTMVPDHGFRGLNDDPMFGNPYNWPQQNWKMNPAPAKSANLRPTSVNSAAFLRRDMDQDVIAAMTAVNGTTDDNVVDVNDDTPTVCHVDVSDEHFTDLDLDYDHLHFEDMDGQPIDGRFCNVIFDSDGHQEDYDYDAHQRESPITALVSQVATATTEQPKTGQVMSTVAARTTAINDA